VVTIAWITDGSAAGHLAAMGNADGDQNGMVEVFAGGMRMRCESRTVTVVSDGVAAVLEDGRRIFVTSGGAVLIDAPKRQQGQA
jgi:hypothetical protein